MGKRDDWSGERPALDAGGPQRVLVVRADRLGDLVISTSILEPLLSRLPEAEVACAVSGAFADLIRPRERLNVWPVESQVNQNAWTHRIAEWRPEVAVFLNPHPELEAAAARAGVPVRMGTSRGRGERLSYWRPYTWKKRGDQHEAAYCFDLLAPLGLEIPGKLLTDNFAHCSYDGDLPNAAQLVHLASFGDKPTVSPRFFAEVAEGLRDRYGWVPVLVGADADDPAIPDFLMHLPKGLRKMVPVLAGQTSVAELAGLCHRACCMVSRDSGPAHLAAATGCPTLTFFLSQRPLMSPRRWFPLGRNSAIYTERIIPIPWESAHREARRITKKLRVDRAVKAMAGVLNPGLS